MPTQLDSHLPLNLLCSTANHERSKIQPQLHFDVYIMRARCYEGMGQLWQKYWQISFRYLRNEFLWYTHLFACTV